MTAVVVQARLALRGLQFILSLLALAFVSASFKSVVVTPRHYTMSLVSSSATFTKLVSCSAMFYALWYIIAVEIFQYAPRPTRQTNCIIDGAVTALLVIAGTVLATSSYVSDCDDYWSAISCGNIKAGVALTFIAMASFLVALAIDLFSASGQIQTTTKITTEHFQIVTPYQKVSTPKDTLSSIGSAKSPDAHV